MTNPVFHLPVDTLCETEHCICLASDCPDECAPPTAPVAGHVLPDYPQADGPRAAGEGSGAGEGVAVEAH